MKLRSFSRLRFFSRCRHAVYTRACKLRNLLWKKARFDAPLMSFFNVETLEGRIAPAVFAGYGPDSFKYFSDGSHNANMAAAGYESLQNDAFAHAVFSSGTINDTAVAVPINFGFSFYGTSYNSVNVTDNGLLTFGATNQADTSGNDTSLLNDALGPQQPSIAALWTDLGFTVGELTNVNGHFQENVYWKDVAASGNIPQHFTIQWYKAQVLSDATLRQVDFEVSLFQNGDIEFRYNDVATQSNGDVSGNSTIGVRDSTPLSGGHAGHVLQMTSNAGGSPFVANDVIHLYNPGQTLSYTTPSSANLVLSQELLVGQQYLEIKSGGNILAKRPVIDTSDVLVTGATGSSQVLTINYTNALFAQPVTFNALEGGNDSDQLVIGAGSAETISKVSHTFTGAKSGTIAITGSTNSPLITYSGVDSNGAGMGQYGVIEGLSTPLREFHYSSGSSGTNDVLEDLSAVSGANRLMSYSAGNGPNVAFLNSAALVIDASAASSANSVQINELDSFFNGSVTAKSSIHGDHLFLTATTGSGTYTLNGGAGNDSIIIGSNVSGNNGYVSAINSHVVVTAGGGGNDVLVVDDSGSVFANNNVVVTSSNINNLSPGAIDYSGGFKNIYLNGSNSQSDTFNIRSLPAGTTLNVDGNGGNDAVVLGQSVGSVSGILGLVAIDLGSGSNDHVSLIDSNEVVGHTYVATSSSISRDGTPLATIANTEFIDLAGGAAADRFEITPAAGVEFFVEGNTPTVPVGDVLYYVGSGALAFGNTPGSGTISHSGVGNVRYNAIETTTASGKLVPLVIDSNVYGFGLADDGLPDAFRIESTPSVAGNTFSIYLNGNYVFGGDTATFDTVQFLGSLDNDTLTVDSTNGLLGFAGGIYYNGGHGSDLLVLQGGTADSDVYQIGADYTSGTNTLTLGSVTEIIHFTGLEPIIDTVVSPLTVIGNNADNAFKYVQGTLGAAYGLVGIDGYETIEFTNKTSLTLDGQGGNDVFNINNPTRPTGLTGIDIIGGGPIAGDQVIINGRAGLQDLFLLQPTGANAGRVIELAALVAPITFSGIGGVSFVGQQADGDSLAVAGTNDADTTILSWGAGTGQGYINGHSNGDVTGNAFNFVPVSFDGLGGVVATPAAGGAVGTAGDVLIIDGTTADDTFNFISTVGAPAYSAYPNYLAGISVDTGGTPHIPVYYNRNISTIVFRGLDGANTYNVDFSAAPAALGVTTFGIEGDAADTLNYKPVAAGVTTLDLQAGQINSTGAKAFTFTNLGHLNIDENGSQLDVLGTTGDDHFSFTPTGAASGIFSDGHGLSVQFSNTNGSNTSFNVLGNGGNDELTIHGGSSADYFTVLGSNVTLTGLQSVTHAAINSLVLSGEAGNDTFEVTSIAGVAVSVIGGDPIGTPSGDSLIINAGVDIVSFTPGPLKDSGGFDIGANSPVSYTQIEKVTVNGGAASGPIINGTYGPDSFTVVGTAAQQFDVFVNDSTAISFTNAPAFTLNGLGGSDEFSITPFYPGWNVTGTINGGQPSAGSDTLTIDGSVGADTANYAPTNGLSDDGVFTLQGGVVINIHTIEHLYFNGLGGGDNLTLTTGGGFHSIDFTPGALADGGSLAIREGGAASANLGLNFSSLGMNGTVTIDAVVHARVNTLTVMGTSAAESFSLDPTGYVQISSIGSSIFRSLPIYTVGVNTLDLQGNGGTDIFRLSPVAGLSTIIVEAGSSAGDSVLVYPTAATGVGAFDLDSAGLAGGGFAGIVSMIGVESLYIDGGGFGVSIQGSALNDEFTVTPVALNHATIKEATHGPLIEVVNFDPLGFSIAGMGGTDKLIVNGTAGDDIFGSNGSQVSIGGVLLTNFTGFSSLVMNGLDGADSFTVAPSAVAVLVDGGAPTSGAGDTLSLYVPTAGLITAYGGATSDQGSIVVDANAAVSFAHIESASIDATGAAAASILIKGTDGADAITILGTGVHNASVAINGNSTLSFINVPTLSVDAGAGSDEISITPFYGAAWNEVVNVNGGDPTAGSDSLVVVGSAASETFVYAASANSLGVNGAAVAVNLTGIEHFTIDGRGGNDLAVFFTPGTADTVSLEAGAGNDSVTAFITSLPLSIPVTFANIGSTGSLTVLDAGGRTDTVLYSGTAGNDTFSLTVDTVTLNSHIPVVLSGADSVTLDGLQGEDTFNVNAGIQFVTLNLHGGTGANKLNAIGTVGADNLAIDLATNQITGLGGIVSTTDIATLNVTGNGGVDAFTLNNLGAPTDLHAVNFAGVAAGTSTLTVNGTSGADSIAYTPSAADAGSFSVAGSEAIVSFTGIGGLLNAAGGAGSDTFRVNATAGKDLITATGAFVTVNSLKTVNFTTFEALNVFAGSGEDIFTVTPAVIPIFIDGGDPIGTTAGDSLLLTGYVGVSTYEQGPHSDEGAFLTLGNERVSFAHIESATITGGPGVGPAVIIGTTDNDQITVIARDASFSPLADGVQDFTVSLNGIFELLYIDTPTFFIDALAGNDDVIVRTPAPNQAAWNVNMTFVGGSPASSATRGDRFVLETPGLSTVSYTPTGADTGDFLIDQGGTPALDSQLHLVNTYTIAAPVPSDPPVYVSSAGGFEKVEYDGQGGGDSFTVIGTAGDDTISHTPGSTPNSGSVQINTLLGVTYQNLGGLGSLILEGSGGTDTLIANGTTADDSFTVLPNGNVQHAGHQTIIRSSIENLTLRGLEGNDLFSISGAAAYTTIRVEGGGTSTGTDTVDFLSQTGTSESIVIAPSLTVPTEQTISGFASSIQTAGVAKLHYTGIGADDKLTVALGAQQSSATVSGSGTAGLDQVTSTNLPVIEYGALNTFAVDATVGTHTVTFVTGGLGGAVATNYQLLGNLNDTLVIQGRDGGNDSYLVTRPAGSSVKIVDQAASAGTVTITETQNSLGRVQINGLGGDDTVSINVDAATSGVLSVPLTFDGGVGHDLLQISGTPASPITDETYTPTPQSNGGRIFYNTGVDNGMTVDFYNLEPVIDLVPVAALNIQGTNGNNAINYGPATNTAHGLVSVDQNETLEFANKVILNLNGLAGSDTININNSFVPTGLTTINVDGGDGTSGSDVLTVNGTTAQDTVTYAPTSFDAGSFTFVGSLPKVNFTTVEQAIYNGLGGNDIVNFQTPAGDQTIQTFPGVTTDSGSIALHDSVGGTFTGLSFLNLGAGSTLNLTDISGGHVDHLVFAGRDFTNGTDVFNVDGAGQIKLNAPAAGGGGLLFPTTNTGGVLNLALSGLAGDDVFNITAGAAPIFQNILVDGGDSTSADVVNLFGNGADVSVQIGSVNGASTVIGGGLSSVAVTLAGSEVLNLNAGVGNIGILGDPSPNFFHVTPTSATQASLYAEGFNPVVNTTNTGSLTFAEGTSGDGDSLTVHGTTQDDDIIITRGADTTVLVNALKLVHVTSANIEALVVRGELGGDILEVFGGGGPRLTVDGNQPLSNPQSDTLIVHGSAAGNNAFTVTEGETTDSGSVGLVNGDGNDVTQFQGIENVIIDAANGAGNNNSATFVANNADNDIVLTILGGGAASLSIDAQPVTNLVGFGPGSAITVNSLAGDDDISLVIATPNASNFTNVYFDAGQPTASDTIIINAVPLFNDALVYQPLGTGAGVFTDNTAAFPTTHFVGAEHLKVVGQSGAEADAFLENFAVGNNTIEWSPGADPSSGFLEGFTVASGGNFAFVPVEFHGFYGFVTAPSAVPNPGNQTLIINGTNANDTFNFGSTAPFGPTFTSIVVDTGANAHTPIFYSNATTTIIMRGLQGDDTYNLVFPVGNSTTPVALSIEGGEGFDTINHVAISDKLTTIDLAGLIISEDANRVSFEGVEKINQISSGAASRLSVVSTLGLDNIDYTPTGPNAGVVLSNNNLEVNFAGVGSTFSINPVGGSDTVTVHGTDNADTISVVRAPQTLVQVNGLKTVAIQTLTTEAIIIAGGLGSDDITVSGYDDVALINHGPLYIDGGDAGSPGDTLTINVEKGITTVNAGATLDSGTVSAPRNSDLSYTGIELLTINGKDALSDGIVINATNADNHITVSRVLGTNEVLIDAHTPIHFGSFFNLSINGQAGDDFFSVSPAGMTVNAINIAGNDPTASDTLLVNGTAGADTIGFLPVSAGAGKVTITGMPTVNFATIEDVRINGNGGGDTLTVTSPAGAQNITYTPGNTVDSGSVQIDSLVSMDFQQLGNTGAIIFADISGNRVDSLAVEGTSANDTFIFDNGSVSINGQLAPAMPGVANLTLKGLEGQDTYFVNGSGPFTSLTLQGGGPGDGDIANLTGSGLAAANVTLGGASVITGANLGTVNLPGIATANLTNGAAAINVSGTGTGESFQVTPTGANTATIGITGYGTTLNTTNAGALTLIPLGGVDSVTVHGNVANNTVAIGLGATTTVAIDANKLINITSAGTELLTVLGLEGNDTFTVTGGAGAPLSIDAGAGDDIVNASAATDGIIIHGGEGNDTLTGGAGVDHIFGDAGNDVITGLGGADQLFGGDGSDTFIWNSGDGSDLVEGGTGTNILSVTGSAAAQAFALSANGARLSVGIAPGVAIDAAGIQQLNLVGNGGADSLTVNDLSTTDVRLVNADFGPAGASTHSIVVNGRQLSDNILITTPGANTVKVAGLAYDVNLSGVTTGDSLTVNGNGGNDIISAVAGVEAAIKFTLDGGAGDDTLSGDGTLLGGDGNDTLTGGAGNNVIDGGAGNDLINGNGGNDTLIGGLGDDVFIANTTATSYDGGAGFDSIVFAATGGNDTIGFNQPNATTLNYTLNGGTTVATIAGIENAAINGGAGDDVLTVVQSDSLVANPSASVRVTFDGGGSVIGDRLAVYDDGLGDTMVQRIGQATTLGSINVGPLAPVFYSNVGFIQALSGGADGAGKLVVFRNDGTEPNNSLANPAHLGAGFAINENLSIDQGVAVAGLPVDQDYFRLETLVDGKFNVNAYFTQVGTLANGRAGLPGNGNLSLEILDAAGNVVVAGAPTSFGANAGFFTHSDQILYVHVKGATPDAINSYSLTITDIALPPFTGGGGSGGGGGFGNNGAFTSAVNYKGHNQPRGLVLGDLNGDGFLDLVASETSKGRVSVSLGRGDGTFLAPTNFFVGGKGKYTITADLADINGDGHLDAVVANKTRGQSDFVTMLGDGTGNLGPAVHQKVAGTKGLFSVRAVDMNGDGDVDVVVTGRRTANVSVLLNDGAGHFTLLGSYKAGKSPHDVVIGDFNGDGLQDVVVGNYSNHNITYLPGMGGGALGGGTNFNTPGKHPTSLAVGDFNGDGHPDVVVTNDGANYISVFMGSGLGGSLEFRTQTQAAYSKNRYAQTVAVGDFDYDGIQDLVVSNLKGREISVLLGNGNGTFSAPFDFSTGHQGRRNPQSIVVGDLNGDGLDDLVVSNPHSNSVSVLLRSTQF